MILDGLSTCLGVCKVAWSCFSCAENESDL